MIRIRPTKKGKPGILRQWDKGRRVIIILEEGCTADEVRFHNGTTEKALVSEVKELDGQLTASIPNLLLQSNNRLYVYLVMTQGEMEVTIETDSFIVLEGPQPDDYVYTEEEIFSYKALEKRVEELEKGGTGSGGSYTLPLATSEVLGGIRADAKTDEDTVPARIGEDGKIYVPTYPSAEQSPIKQVPYFATQESGTNGLYFKVDIEELEPLVIYANGEEVEGKTVSCYMAIRCDDGTEKAITSFGRNTLFYIQRVDNTITLYTVEGNYRYSIDVTDKSNKSKVKSQILWNQKYLEINNNAEYVPTKDYNPATKKYVEDTVKNREKTNWEQEDETQPDYIKNKPFYEFSQKTEVFPYQQITLGAGGVYEFNPPLSLEEGEECVVEINLIPLTVKYEEELYLFGTEYENTIGQVVMLSSEGLIIISPVNTRIYLEIYKISKGIKQIEDKFIPSDIARMKDVYSKKKIDVMFGSYVTDIANLIGGIEE